MIYKIKSLPNQKLYLKNNNKNLEVVCDPNGDFTGEIDIRYINEITNGLVPLHSVVYKRIEKACLCFNGGVYVQAKIEV